MPISLPLALLAVFQSQSPATAPPPVVRTPAIIVPVPPKRPAAELFDRPVPPKPRQPLASLFSYNDYPQAAMQLGREGDVAALLTIDPEGRVESCFIDSGAGDPHLDVATCRILRSRARFEPARDANRVPVRGAYPAPVSWRIPLNMRVPLTAWRSEVTATIAPDGRILSCQESMEGITRPPNAGCRGFRTNGPLGVGASRKDGQASRLRLQTQLIPGAIAAADLPRVDGEVLHRVAARLRIEPDGRVSACDFVEQRGLLVSLARQPPDCRRMFRGPYQAVVVSTDVTTIATMARLN